MQIKESWNTHLIMPGRSQGGQVGYSLDFHPGGPGSTPARGNQQKKVLKKEA